MVRLAVAIAIVSPAPSRRRVLGRPERPVEAVGDRAGSTIAGLGQQQPEAACAEPDGAIGLARLGADGIADDGARDRSVDGGRRAVVSSMSRTDAGRP